MAASCCRQWCFIRLCNSLQHPLIPSSRKFTSFLLSRLGKIHLSKALSSSKLLLPSNPFTHFLLCCKKFQFFCLLTESLQMYFSPSGLDSVSLHVTPFVWNSFLATLKFSWFTWPFNSSSLLPAPTFTLNLQVHLSKLH